MRECHRALRINVTRMTSHKSKRMRGYHIKKIPNYMYTVELQWFGHLWKHENMFETGVVRANECYSSRQVKYIFSIFFNMKVCCVFSLESPH